MDKEERISKMDALLFALVLEVALLQLRIQDNKKLASETQKSVVENLQLKRNEWALELCKGDHQVAVLRDKLKDDLLNAGTRLRYAERWLGARAEALELRYQWAGATAPRVDHEARVHQELVKSFELQIKEREASLEYWRVRYSDDTAQINERLANVRDLYMEAIKRRENLQSLYDLHEGEMRGWLTFKRERAARLAREARLRAAATRLQAWWRGVMVRAAFGQYKYLRHAKKLPAKGKKK
ncbi:uncharacterized protein [Choristoneura fumiferana]|uniref:uncharacterized protein n=1 Tax=Choristoneura fumiferana TaxID=7141 RepID=UPI003D15C41E